METLLRWLRYGIWASLAALAFVVGGIILELWSDDTEFRLLFLAMGATLVLSGSTLVLVNLMRDSDFVAVAPYAGKQSVQSRWVALVWSGMLVLMGVGCLLVGFGVW